MGAGRKLGVAPGTMLTRRRCAGPAAATLIRTLHHIPAEDQIFHKGLGTDNYISLSGGSDKTKYYFSGGFYKNEGIPAFIKKYGYADVSGKADRMNFGGVYKAGIVNKRTNLELQLIGFDKELGKIRSTARITNYVALITKS